MEQRTLGRFLLIVAVAGLFGCDQLPGKPKIADRWQPPQAEKNFTVLYNTNCLGCHSDGQTISASNSMHDPLYLAIIPKELMRRIIAEGLPGTTMPGFGESAGGQLTDQQVDIVANGIYDWAKGHESQPADLPPYSAPLGDAQRGATVYGQYCAGCHGNDGKGTKAAGSVVNPSYLSLVSDQYLRTVVIVGRPELGMPNYQKTAANKPMTAQEIADVVAWLVSHRPAAAVTPPPQAAATPKLPNPNQ